MTPERWQKADDVFHRLADQPLNGIGEILRVECGDDQELYDEVRRMLEANARSGLLDQHPWDLATAEVFSPGDLIAERYRIVRFVNRGGMGEVYEAEDQDLHEIVALKTLIPPIARDDTMIRRFKQEIQLSRKVSHPNVCRVFDLSRHRIAPGPPPEVVLFLTMEFLRGEPLSERLQREGRLKPEEAGPLLAQMADGLDAAHRAGVIHRDFKPSNVMLVPDAGGTRAVVTDFGLARSLELAGEPSTKTMSGRLMGTLDYMAPELLTGGVASPASDVYALGMVAYKMVTGALPFASDSPLAGVIRRAKDPMQSPRALTPDLDPRWERAILRAVHSDPARRFAKPSDFAAALLGDSRVRAIPLPRVGQRKLVAAGAIALIVMFAGWLSSGALKAPGNPASPEAMHFYRQGTEDFQAGAWWAASKALEHAVSLAPQFCLAHARLSEAYVELDLPDKAAEEMVLARRTEGSTLSRADRLRLEAIDFSVTREFASGAAKYELIRRLAPGDDDVDIDLGRTYERVPQIDKAVESYRRAAEGPMRNPAAWLHLGIIYSRRSESAHADEAFLKAQQLYELSSNNEGLIELAIWQAFAADRRGDFEKAARFLNTALETAKLGHNTYQQIRARIQFAVHYTQAGDIGRVEASAKEALELARMEQMERFAIMGVVQTGIAYRGRQEYAAAEAQFREAVDLAQRNNAAHVRAVAQFNLASLHDLLKKPKESGAEAREALAFYKSNGYTRESAQCRVMMGRAARKLGDWAAANDSFQEALRLAQKSGDTGALALANESLGSLEFEEENYPRALDHYRKNLELIVDPRGIGYARLQCGNLLWLLGDYQHARAMFDAGDAVAGPFKSLHLMLLVRRAEMELSAGRYSDASALATRAIAEGADKEPLLEAQLQDVIGQVQMAGGKASEGLSKCRKSLETVTGADDAALLLSVRLIVAQAELDSGHKDRAAALLQQINPTVHDRPESRWRALALRARIDRSFAATAMEAQKDLGTLWGEAPCRQYLQRPDIGILVARISAK